MDLTKLIYTYAMIFIFVNVIMYATVPQSPLNINIQDPKDLLIPWNVINLVWNFVTFPVTIVQQLFNIHPALAFIALLFVVPGYIAMFYIIYSLIIAVVMRMQI